MRLPLLKGARGISSRKVAKPQRNLTAPCLFFLVSCLLVLASCLLLLKRLATYYLLLSSLLPSTHPSPQGSCHLGFCLLPWLPALGTETGR